MAGRKREAEMSEEKRINLEKTLSEMQQGLEHIENAIEITTCSLCVRDLTLSEMMIQNLVSIISDLLEEKKMGKKKKGMLSEKQP